MKKEKQYQAAEQYLTGRDREMIKKFEFLKTQGTLFRKVLASIEWQTKWTQYIISCFERSAIQFPIKGSSDETTGEAREWASFSDLRRIKQLLTQEQMKAICQSIADGMHANKSYNLPDSVIIHFEDGTLEWHEMMYMLDDSVIETEFFSLDPLESRLESFVHRFKDKIKGTIYIGDDHGSPRAILKAAGDDGSDYFFELTHFSMLYLLDRDNKAFDEETCSGDVVSVPDENSHVDNKREEADKEKKESEKKTDPMEYLRPDMDREDGEVGMFTLFSKIYDMMFVTTY